MIKTIEFSGVLLSFVMAMVMISLLGCSKDPVVHQGSVAIEQIADIEKFTAFTHIEGDLNIGLYTGPHHLAFPNLTHVSGSIEMWASAVHVLRFDELREVKGTFRIAANEKLEELHAPRLKTVGDFLGVMTNRKLIVLELDSLERVGERADVSINRKLSTCELEKIRKDLSANQEFFYYYDNKSDGCKDHQFRYDKFIEKKRTNHP